MPDYYRITAYLPAENISAVFDSNVGFEKLWQFSSYLLLEGFKNKKKMLSKRRYA